MPIHRRLPKFGFSSRKAQYVAEIRLNELTLVEGDTVDLAALKAADVIGEKIKEARVILSGEISKAVTVKGMKVTKGAKAAIEAAGGKVED
jgi:large subunit ribosomal protein L15